MPTTITSAGITFNDATSLTSANGVPSALKLTTARTINGVSFDGTANITVPASGTSTAKAWVNFNGFTSPGTIRSSYNVSSVTYNAAGNYTINFLTPMPDTNYVVAGAANDSYPSASGNPIVYIGGQGGVAPTTSGCRIAIGQATGNDQDATIVNIIVFGN